MTPGRGGSPTREGLPPTGGMGEIPAVRQEGKKRASYHASGGGQLVPATARKCSVCVESGIPYPGTVEYVWVLPLTCVFACVLAAAYSARAWPIGVRRKVSILEERVVAAEANVESLAAKWQQAAAENAAFLEEAEGVLQAVERKRRRAAASAAKANGESAELTDRDALTRLARERGFRV